MFACAVFLKWFCLAPLQVGSRVRLRSVPLLTTIKASYPLESLPCMAPAVPGREGLSKLASLLQEVGQYSFRMKLGGAGEDTRESTHRIRNSRVREGEEKGSLD